MWASRNRTRTPHLNVRRKTQHEETKTNPCGFFKINRQSDFLANAAAKLKGNAYNGNIIGIGADFAKKTQNRRKALLPYKKHLQKKLGAGRKVFIAYPAILKYIDKERRQKTVGEEALKKLKGEMTKYT